MKQGGEGGKGDVSMRTNRFLLHVANILGHKRSGHAYPFLGLQIDNYVARREAQ